MDVVGQPRNAESACRRATQLGAGDFDAVVRAFRREHPARRPVLTAPLIAVLAARAEVGTTWDPDLDQGVHIATLVQGGCAESWILDRVAAVLRFLPTGRGRRILEPCFAPRVTFPTGAAAFLLSGTVPLVEPAYYWLRRAVAGADFPGPCDSKWICHGIAEQPDPMGPLQDLLQELRADGLDLETGAHPHTPRPELVDQLRAGVALHPGLPTWTRLLQTLPSD